MPTFDLTLRRNPIPPGAPHGRAARLGSRRPWRIVSLWIERVRQRDALAGMDDHHAARHRHHARRSRARMGEAVLAVSACSGAERVFWR